MQKKSIERNKDKLMSNEKVITEIREKGITLVALVITFIVFLVNTRNVDFAIGCEYL